ncbi:MAG: phytoene/squalene synthase family protein, partial [Actinobacteria bacterium]|nr:phytoene/squalene synthase family protein [Actinomycetota bacterium]
MKLKRRNNFRCQSSSLQHGKTYFLATLLLPKNKRPFVHALYGFARYADEIVDDLDSKLSPQEKRAELERWSYQLLQDIKAGRSSDHIGRALVDTVKRFDIPIAYFEAFLHSMAMDLDKTEYATFEELMEYVYGSAAVIGLQMLPILGTIPGKFNESKIAAEKLGIAF